MYHVLNRSVGMMHLFGKDAVFEAFQRVMIEAHQRHPIRILSYCILSNHWHFAVWPDADGRRRKRRASTGTFPGSSPSSRTQTAR